MDDEDDEDDVFDAFGNKIATKPKVEYDDAPIQAAVYNAVSKATAHAFDVFNRRQVTRMEERVGIFVTSLRQHLTCSEFGFNEAQMAEFSKHRSHLCEVKNWSDVGVLGAPDFRWNGNRRKWVRTFYPSLEYQMNMDRLRQVVTTASAGDLTDFNPHESLSEMKRIIEDTRIINAKGDSINSQAVQISARLHCVAESLEQPVVDV